MNLIFDADGVATPGAENFYRNVFGLRTEQRRDVFQRQTILERFYQRYRQQFKAVIALKLLYLYAMSATEYGISVTELVAF
jgi:hypothetical protein